MKFSFVPIRADRLLRRTIEVGGRRSEGVSILPFFEQDGRVRHIVLIRRDSSEIYLLPADDVVLKRAIFCRTRIAGSVRPFEPIRKADLSSLEKLWHYDPVWLLDEERFAGHWARELLKNTNCLSRLPSKTRLYFRGDLSRVQWIVSQESADGVSAAKWNGAQLPVSPPALKSRARQKPTSGWVLDPIWSRR